MMYEDIEGQTRGPEPEMVSIEKVVVFAALLSGALTLCAILVHKRITPPTKP